MKPADFMVSLRDLFAVFVPGAVLLWLLPSSAIEIEHNAINILVLVVAAYLAGSVASGVGALADHLIDRLFAFTRLDGFKRFKELRTFEKAANALRDKALDRLDALVAPDRLGLAGVWSARSFWWTQIRIHCPPGLLELDRIEAHQKLFRSLIVVFAVLATVEWLFGGSADRLPGSAPRHLAWVWLALAVGSLVPYMAGRFHFARTVYGFAATLCLQRADEPPKAKG